MATKLILIRHGETDYNLENRYCGFSDPPLNNKGVEQAKRLATQLVSINVDKVYSSDLQRSYESAKIIFRDSPIEKVKDLREMNFGVFERLRYEEILRLYPKIYKDWVAKPMEVVIPNGEGLKELNKRVGKKLNFILSQYKNATIALVIHGGPIRIILCEALNFDLNMFWQIEQDIGALNIVDYSKRAVPQIVKMNDVSHLSF